jgi:hypothetical protein
MAGSDCTPRPVGIQVAKALDSAAFAGENGPNLGTEGRQLCRIDE